jgi:hypothetical protein
LTQDSRTTGDARRYERLDKRFTLAIYLLFSVTVVAAFVRSTRDLGDDWSHRVTYVSVALSALSALTGALDAIRAQRQWLPNKEPR